MSTRTMIPTRRPLPGVHRRPGSAPAGRGHLLRAYGLTLGLSAGLGAGALPAWATTDPAAAIEAASPGWIAQAAPAASAGGGPREQVEVVIEGGPRMAQSPMGIDLLVEDAFDRAAVDLGRERLVKGAPYCADAVHETVQPLLDVNGQPGNRIVRRTTTRLCRDGEGRTRQELERNGRKLVLLHDPVARESWVLDPEKRTARRSGPLGLAGGPGTDAASSQDYAERMREWAQTMAERARSAVAGKGAPTAPPAPAAGPAAPVPPAAPVAPEPPRDGAPRREAELVFLSRPPGPDGDDARRQVEVQVIRLEGGPAGPGGAVPPAVNWTARQFAPRGEGVVTGLGSRELEGLRVHGERTTWTIEAGKVGNEKPIQVVRDVWTSPDLMLAVATRDFDPRRGETSYRLARIRRGEPDPASMKVPADYSRPVPRAPSVPGGRG